MNKHTTPLLVKSGFYEGKRVWALHIFHQTKSLNDYYALPAGEQSRPIHICNDCEKLVAWVTSKRTGKQYLCDVTVINLGGQTWRFFNPSTPHFKTCTKDTQ